MRKNTLFIIYLIFGLYLFNMAFNLISLGGLLGSKIYNFLNQGVLIVSAVLVIVEGFRHLNRGYN